MLNLVPFLLKDEEAHNKEEITSEHLPITFDRTSQLDEALAVIVDFAGKEWTLERHLIRMQMLPTLLIPMQMLPTLRMS